MSEMVRCSIGEFCKRFSLFQYEGELRKLSTYLETANLSNGIDGNTCIFTENGGSVGLSIKWDSYAFFYMGKWCFRIYTSGVVTYLDESTIESCMSELIKAICINSDIIKFLLDYSIDSNNIKISEKEIIKTGFSNDVCGRLDAVRFSQFCDSMISQFPKFTESFCNSIHKSCYTMLRDFIEICGNELEAYNCIYDCTSNSIEWRKSKSPNSIWRFIYKGKILQFIFEVNQSEEINVNIIVDEKNAKYTSEVMWDFMNILNASYSNSVLASLKDMYGYKIECNLAFRKYYKGTGRELQDVIRLLNSKGYDRKEIIQAIIHELGHEVWE